MPTTAAPTNPPTWMPTTPAPTYHSCKDGSHGCDKSPCGVCLEVGDGWECGCAPGCICTRGCDKPHQYHVCEKTKEPTNKPTWMPTTAAPTTKAPTTWMPTTAAPTTKTPTTKTPTTGTPTTKTPTTATPTTATPTTPAPTYHPCKDGSHGCDKSPCGVCLEVG